MVHQMMPLNATGAFSTLFLDYISQKKSLQPFYNNFPLLDNFLEQIRQKQDFSENHRRVLTQSLQQQYKHIGNPPSFDILNQPNTFTITTGHQLNIFTGPLYVIYKIITTINLAHTLRQTYPEYNFVPVYWMASEDHDFEEINHFNLFGKKYTWQTQQKGAVGRMNPRELGEALKILPERVPVFEKAYLNATNLTNAVRSYMHDLFGHEGLICIDGDDANLKQLFLPILEDDLKNQTAFEIVNKTTKQLEDLGYHTQIAPREINLFYLEDKLRERIVKQAPQYQILNTNIEFTEEEIHKILYQNPEKFSPNVVLRPLYQETILPNLAYVGGPSEVPYWLQLKDIFDHYRLPFPMLLPRNFALYLNQDACKKAEKLNVSVEKLFWDEARLRKDFVSKLSTVPLELTAEKEKIYAIFEQIQLKAQQIDKTLEGTVGAEKVKIENLLTNLEKRLQKAEERNHEVEINQLIGLKNKLFPNGGLQERADNFLNFYLNDDTFLKQLLAYLNPLDFQFNVLLQA